MSPEYNFYLHANLKDDREAEELAEELRRLQGVEIVAKEDFHTWRVL